MMKKDAHMKTPFFTALLDYAKSDVVSLDVPGHKLGKIENDMKEVTGDMLFKLDANAPRGLDTLSKPKGVIKEAEALMADAYGADRAYFLVNGTTVGILTMIMSAVKAREKVIMPRNVHKSAINALILSGAVPVFIEPDLDHTLGIANGMAYEKVEQAVMDHPDARAIFCINPTYFGVVSDLAKIVKLAKENNMMVLVDEAHGSQFPFSPLLPSHAMECGADMAATSFHKTAGSLTQSSVLMTKGQMANHNRIQSTLNLLQSTSPSGLFIASLDVARKKMVLDGEAEIEKLIALADDTRSRINTIPGISAVGQDYFIRKGSYDFDRTKLIIKVSDLGITGFELYNILRDEFNIQLELAETHLILGVLSIGTTKRDMDRLVHALEVISTRRQGQLQAVKRIKFEYTYPETYTRPRSAYHAPKKFVLLEDALDEISGESIMIYPPGIPLVIPGEIISQEVIDDLNYYIECGSTIFSDQDDGYIKVVDKENWIKWSDEDEDL